MFTLRRTIVLAAVTGLASSAAWAQGPCCPSWWVESDQAQARMGDVVASAGDVNGDGYDDVLVGAIQYTNDQPYEGRAFVYLGSATGLATTPVWIAELDQAAGFSRALAGVGDVNGDGYDDVLVGASTYDHGETNEGAAFLYLGSATGPSPVPDWTAEGDQPSLGFAAYLAGAGDVNGDGYDDVLIAATAYENGQTHEGGAFLYLGSAAGLSTTRAWTGESDQANAGFGPVSAAGDVNGDGYDDVIAGAYDFDSGQTNEGRAFLYLGSATGLATSPAWTADGDEGGGNFGRELATSDVNGDGFDDVIVGDHHWDYVGFDTYLSARARAYLGSPTGLSTSAAWTALHDEGNAEYGDSGYSLSGAGDVNGDGYGDVVVGTLGFESELFGTITEGKAYVYLGSPTGLPARAAWSVEGNKPNYWFGTAVAGAGDVDGDGFDDVLVGVPHAGDLAGEGRAYLYPGSAAFVSATVFSGDGLNADTVEPLNAVAGLSWSLPLALGHAHGSSGPLGLMIRSAPINGPNFTSPVGGRLTELLVGGPALAMISGTHDGAHGDVPPQSIPNQASLLGVPWAAQYVVAGAGYADLSQAAYGFVGCRP